MTWEVGPGSARDPRRDCSRGGGRNRPGLHAVDLIESDEFTRPSPARPGWRVALSSDLERMADALAIGRATLAEELKQMARRGTIERESIGDGDWRLRVVR